MGLIGEIFAEVISGLAAARRVVPEGKGGMGPENSVTSLTFSLNEVYLPPDRQGLVETYIRVRRPKFVGRILAIDELAEFPLQKICYGIIASCTKSMTVGFTDKPFYFCVSGSHASNAIIVDLGPLHCMIIGEELCSFLVQLVGGIAVSTSLQRFLREGVDPEEPDIELPRTRTEALAHLLEHAADAPGDASGGQLAILSSLTMYFLACHEIGHVALGHLESRLMPDSLAMELHAGIGETPKESRALEWDADCFAGAATLWYTGASPQLPELAEFFPDYESGLRYVFVAAYAFFTALDLQDDKTASEDERSHPAPLVRIMMMAFVVSAMAQNWGNTTADAVMEIVGRSIRAFEIALQEIGGGCMQPEESIALDAAFQRQMGEAVATFERIKPTLNRARLANYFWAGAAGL